DNEGFNAYHADAAVGGGPLYPLPGGVIVNNYPPLSFYALGWVGQGFCDSPSLRPLPSRLFSSGPRAPVAPGGLQHGGGGAGAAVGGLWFIATMARSYNRYVGMNDPQLAAQLIMMAALSWFLAREKAGKSAEPPILLMLLAGFWKHNIIAIPATAIAW